MRMDEFLIDPERAMFGENVDEELAASRRRVRKSVAAAFKLDNEAAKPPESG